MKARWCKQPLWPLTLAPPPTAPDSMPTSPHKTSRFARLKEGTLITFCIVSMFDAVGGSMPKKTLDFVQPHSAYLLRLQQQGPAEKLSWVASSAAWDTQADAGRQKLLSNNLRWLIVRIRWEITDPFLIWKQRPVALKPLWVAESSWVLGKPTYFPRSLRGVSSWQLLIQVLSCYSVTSWGTTNPEPGYHLGRCWNRWQLEVGYY